MNIKGQEYLYGRCLRVAFAGVKNVKDPSTGKAMTEFFITHAPDVNRDNYVAMDVSVTDRPNARSQGNPGWQATVTVYNPTQTLLNVINSGATWVTDYVSENAKSADKANAIKNFYASRLTCTISAGYLNKDGMPDWHVIMKGYVNGSSLARKGVEEVLTFGVMDIDMLDGSLVAEEQLANIYGEQYKMQRMSDANHLNKFEKTWYETLVKYIRMWETGRIADPQSDYDKNRSLQYELSTKPQQTLFPMRTDFSRITEEERPFTPISEVDRQKNNWFEIKFVSSLKQYLTTVRKLGRDIGDTFVGRGNIAVDLEVDLKKQIMPTNGAIYGVNLAQMLDGLCARACHRVGWYCDKTNRKRNTYIIYPLGNDPLWVDGEKAGIQIWNYQNLLESPSVSGAGIMTVKMTFNPSCVCGISLALMLDRTLIAGDDATRNLSRFESGDYGSMASSAQLATFGTVQLGSSNAVAATRRVVQDGKSRGYMFNIGFPIIEVKHELSTYGKNWTTTVKTVPMTAGLTYKQQKAIKGVN